VGPLHTPRVGREAGTLPRTLPSAVCRCPSQPPASSCTADVPGTGTAGCDECALLAEGSTGIGLPVRKVRKGSKGPLSARKREVYACFIGVLRGFDGFDRFDLSKVLSRLFTPEKRKPGYPGLIGGLASFRLFSFRESLVIPVFPAQKGVLPGAIP